MEKNEFEYRQGSGYISKDSLPDWKVTAIITNMSLNLEWLKYCIKQIDVTNIGKQHSLLDIINDVKDSLDDLGNMEI